MKQKTICDKCHGNGYVKIEVQAEKKVFQCWICNSEGEISINDGTSITNGNTSGHASHNNTDRIQ